MQTRNQAKSKRSDNLSNMDQGDNNLISNVNASGSSENTMGNTSDEMQNRTNGLTAEPEINLPPTNQIDLAELMRTLLQQNKESSEKSIRELGEQMTQKSEKSIRELGEQMTQKSEKSIRELGEQIDEKLIQQTNKVDKSMQRVSDDISQRINNLASEIKSDIMKELGRTFEQIEDRLQALEQSKRRGDAESKESEERLLRNFQELREECQREHQQVLSRVQEAETHCPTSVSNTIADNSLAIHALQQQVEQLKQTGAEDKRQIDDKIAALADIVGTMKLTESENNTTPVAAAETEEVRSLLRFQKGQFEVNRQHKAVTGELQERVAHLENRMACDSELANSTKNSRTNSAERDSGHEGDFDDREECNLRGRHEKNRNIQGPRQEEMRGFDFKHFLTLSTESAVCGFRK
ncbi:structural maintenance of chromosomes protein 2-1-like [Schistocerca americana]|uniref:structural maintenance of chromosomes protein 2-1-like n=1 Tax=Schistocerca americana TaxID=7009 RepID=UPI001F4F79BC|nr:structural maintenance of chromosomes protein 2-1-like [Schistocerca americana]